MNCRSCNYPLWNIRDRVCPECGSPFVPSDFEFIANSVRFRCPHCGQDYYGTDARGHLEPRRFGCVRCTNALDMDEMVILPRAGIDERRTRVEVLPWIDRHSGGFFKRYFKTTWMAITRPGELAECARGTPTGAAWGLYLVLSVLTLGIWLAPFALIMLPMIGVGRGLVALGGFTIVGAVLLLIALAWPVASHALLRATGKRGEGFGGTVRAIAYSSPVHCISWIPCLGQYIFFASIVWQMVLATIMMMRIHAIGGWRAAFAVITPPLLAFIVLVGGYAGLLFYSVRPAVRTASLRIAQSEMSLVSTAMLRTSSGQGWPSHGVELLGPSGILSPMDFIAGDWQEKSTLPARITVAGRTLDQLFITPPDERAPIDDLAAGDLDPGWAAHRVGDLVFTYNGVAANSPRWVVIRALAPALHPGQAIESYAIIQADGAVLTLTAEEFPAALDAENIEREGLGLPPIPDPSTVP